MSPKQQASHGCNALQRGKAPASNAPKQRSGDHHLQTGGCCAKLQLRDDAEDDCESSRCMVEQPSIDTGQTFDGGGVDLFAMDTSTGPV